MLFFAVFKKKIGVVSRLEKRSCDCKVDGFNPSSLLHKLSVNENINWFKWSQFNNLIKLNYTFPEMLEVINETLKWFMEEGNNVQWIDIKDNVNFYHHLSETHIHV